MGVRTVGRIPRHFSSWIARLATSPVTCIIAGLLDCPVVYQPCEGLCEGRSEGPMTVRLARDSDENGDLCGEIAIREVDIVFTRLSQLCVCVSTEYGHIKDVNLVVTPTLLASRGLKRNSYIFLISAS